MVKTSSSPDLLHSMRCTYGYGFDGAENYSKDERIAEVSKRKWGKATSMVEAYRKQPLRSLTPSLQGQRIHPNSVVTERKTFYTVNGKMLVVEGNCDESRLKVVSCIKARKYIERGCHLFVAHVTEKEPKERRLEDIPVIRDFPEVFPDDLPGLPPPRQVEFKIELVPGAAPERIHSTELIALRTTTHSRTHKSYDMILGYCRSVNKLAHFMPDEKDLIVWRKLNQLYLKETCLLDTAWPISILSDRRYGFALGLWNHLQNALRNEVNMSTCHHPEIDGQITCGVLKPHPLQDSIGRKCRSPICWSEVGDSQLTGPELVRETTEKIVQIKNRLLTARSRQKSYADVRRKPMEFSVGDMVMLKVSPWKGVIRFGKRGKLSPRYIGPCLADENLIIPFEEIQLDDKLHFIEEPVEIMDREVKRLKQSRIPIVKVRWNSRRGPEFTWEREDFFRSRYPHLILRKRKGESSGISTGSTAFLREDGCETPYFRLHTYLINVLNL
ncbi:hypothetical protein Tco_0303931 [Tanacetum coccineum]